MQNDEPSAPGATSSSEPVAAPTRKRPKPGERRVQILQALAARLEQPGAERVTTAALAARLEVSEAALYRHFASKAQMFEHGGQGLEDLHAPLARLGTFARRCCRHRLGTHGTQRSTGGACLVVVLHGRVQNVKN